MTKDSCELLARIGTALYDPDVLTRQDADALYTALDALVAEVERLRAVSTMHDKSVAAGEQRERAAVVAWLLDAAQDCRLCGQQRESAALLDAADCIERGDHRREEEK